MRNLNFKAHYFIYIHFVIIIYIHAYYCIVLCNFDKKCPDLTEIIHFEVICCWRYEHLHTFSNLLRLNKKN